MVIQLTEKEYKRVQLREGYSVQVARQHRTKPAEPKPAKPRSELEQLFLFYWKELNGPPLKEEYVFFSERKWRTDFAHVESKTAIEVEGGVHKITSRYNRDIEKYNKYTMLGWGLWRVTRETINKVTVQAIIDYIRGRQA